MARLYWVYSWVNQDGEMLAIACWDTVSKFVGFLNAVPVDWRIL